VIIEMENVSKAYGTLVALREVDMRIETGGVVGLLGPNGAGKTTLVEILEGLRQPSSGRVSVLGLDPTRGPRALKERIGAQLQSTALPQDLTPLETLRLFAAFYEKSLPPREVLRKVGLEGEAQRRNYTLSGGQARRLAIALALVNDPELIILDEPTSGLDPVARREVHGQIAQFKTSGRTVLLSTHYIDEAETLCDRVVILSTGTIVAQGTPFDLVAAARGTSILWVAVEGELDPGPLLRAGAVPKGRKNDYLCFETSNPAAVIQALGEALQHQRLTLGDLRMKRPNLEDVYLDLVGKSSSEHMEDL
jgi:ABC-2 type transport system ATP-binding protein